MSHYHFWQPHATKRTAAKLQRKLKRIRLIFFIINLLMYFIIRFTILILIQDVLKKEKEQILPSLYWFVRLNLCFWTFPKWFTTWTLWPDKSKATTSPETLYLTFSPSIDFRLKSFLLVGQLSYQNDWSVFCPIISPFNFKATLFYLFNGHWNFQFNIVDQCIYTSVWYLVLQGFPSLQFLMVCRHKSCYHFLAPHATKRTAAKTATTAKRIRLKFLSEISYFVDSKAIISKKIGSLAT